MAYGKNAPSCDPLIQTNRMSRNEWHELMT